MANSHLPTNPEEPEAREDRLSALIFLLDLTIKAHDTHVSGHAIDSIRDAKEELEAERRLLQRGII